MSAVRVDRWLCAARVYKSRTEATRACGAGQVEVNGVAARPATPVKVGDQLCAQAPRGKLVLVIRALADKRQSPPKARELYEDHSPPPPPREERMPARPRGAGRPTKADRRAFERMRGERD
jgi:ribosome-associated heat shock protein Hsp15